MSNITDPSRSKQGKSQTPVVSIGAAWTERLLRESEGPPKSILANAIIAFQHAPEWSSVLAFDEASLAVVVTSKPPWHVPSSRRNHSSTTTPTFPYDWTDADTIRATNWLQHQHIQVGKEIASQAIEAASRDRPFHPIYDYLDALVWDGEPRIDYWLTTYLSSDHTPYTAAVGSRFLISAVARVYHPGSKVDTCLILEGEQGKLKSTALRVLCGADWFTDELPDIRKKDAAIQLLGIWMVELAELDAFEGVALSSIKKFITRAVDRFRPPWGTRAMNVPRGCVFAATVNHATYLRDETGGRRFWPVRTDFIDVDSLAEDRDQLWAEAVTRYKAKAKWHLDTPALIAAASAEQAERYESDPWETRVDRHTAGLTTTSIAEILESCLKKERGEWTQRDQNRISRCLRVLGWERYNSNQNGEREWRYQRKLVPVGSSQNHSGTGQK